MGFERVRGLVLTIAMKSYVGGAMTIPGLQVCWRHSLACAMIAEDLAMAIFIDKDVAYTAGLMHDVGRLALAVLRPEIYAGLLRTATGHGDDLIQLERQTFGFDHCQAGQALIAAWNLPHQFAVVTGEHHDATKRGMKPLGVLQVVGLSCAIADAIGFGVAQPQQAEPYDGLMKHLPVDCLSRFPADPAELTKKISDKINLVELP
jgi:putative nucleotidyltransferase with HDIG domain